MHNETFIQKLERLPVPLLAAMVGAATLSNIYAGLSYVLIRHITMIAATIILLCFTVKIIRYPKTFLGEYKTTVPSSLYAAFCMLLMILGSYYFDYLPVLGKSMWFAGIILHAVHIIIFAIRNVIMKRTADTFVPSWFVTFDGILVSCVVGGAMNEPKLLTFITYYGVIIYFILIPLIIWRLLKYDIKEGMYHTQAVVLAPCSLCVVACINILQNPNLILVSILYMCVLISLLFVLIKLPKFLSYNFHPGFAGLTFPMAIGMVASMKMTGYLEGHGFEELSFIVKQISGVQLYLTTGIIAFVLFQFILMFRKTYQK